MRKLLLSSTVAALALALAGYLAAPQPAQAASQIMCAPIAAGVSPGPRQVTNPNTSHTYSLGTRGCALMAAGDIGYFRAQGFSQGAQEASFVYNGLTANGQIGTLPASAYIREIIVENLTTNAVTGGVGVGKTSAATDIVTALTCAASCLTFVTDANLKLRVFTTSQPIFVSGVTSFNSAILNVTVVYGWY
jgi:hypothetical protein